MRLLQLYISRRVLPLDGVGESSASVTVGGGLPGKARGRNETGEWRRRDWRRAFNGLL
ncbi:hypothetical protein BC826DRAFT_998896 [Russula brevipes]|nr:hypothetical protein BC826DRAFT_998896 [Russula brevipes]